MKNLKVVLITQKSGKVVGNTRLHTNNNTILLDHYGNAYSVSIMDAQRACVIAGVDYQEFLKAELKNAKGCLAAIIDEYGDVGKVDEAGNGMYVMDAKERVENIKNNLAQIKY